MQIIQKLQNRNKKLRIEPENSIRTVTINVVLRYKLWTEVHFNFYGNR